MKLRFSLYFMAALVLLAPLSQAHGKTIDLTSVSDKDWTETVDYIEKGDVVKIDDKEFHILTKPLSSAGSVVFILENTVLKIQRMANENFKDGDYSIKKEIANLKHQGQSMRAPRVYFQSANSRVIEKEFIKGPVFEDWVHTIQLGVSNEKLNEDVQKIFITQRFFSLLKQKNLMFDDPVQTNFAFDDNTQELVAFDANKMHRTIRGLPIIGTSILEETLNSHQDSSIFWNVGIYYWKRYGDSEESFSKTIALLKILGQSPQFVFESLYKLNSFHILYPEEFKYLTEKMEFFANLGCPFFKEDLDDAFSSKKLTLEQKTNLAGYVLQSGMPGEEIVRDYMNKGVIPKPPYPKGFKEICKLIIRDLLRF